MSVFDPRKLRGQSADLLVEFVGLLVVGGFLCRLCAVAALEDRGQPSQNRGLAEPWPCRTVALQNRGLPLADLVRMDAVLRSDLSQGFVFAQAA